MIATPLPKARLWRAVFKMRTSYVVLMALCIVALLALNFVSHDIHMFLPTLGKCKVAAGYGERRRKVIVLTHLHRANISLLPYNRIAL